METPIPASDRCSVDGRGPRPRMGVRLRSSAEGIEDSSPAIVGTSSAEALAADQFCGRAMGHLRTREWISACAAVLPGSGRGFYGGRWCLYPSRREPGSGFRILEGAVSFG